MRRLSTLLLLAAAVLPATASAKSSYTAQCAAICKPDSTLPDEALLPDPRSLTSREKNNGFTSNWQDCHSGPNSPYPQFTTCREWCAARDLGHEIIAAQGLIGSFLNKDTFNNLWRAWGLSDRPPQSEFQERIVDRYGLQPMPPGIPNPYPLPGENTEVDDPTNAEGRLHPGGSGSLPMGLIQTRGENGRYDGRIGFTCLLCHAGRIGDESDGPGLGSRFGIGNTTFDVDVFSYDLGKAGGIPIPLPYPHNEGRGTINAVSDFEFLMIVRDFDTLNNSPFVKTMPAHPSPGDQDPPAWHNTGSRPRVYMDGGVSSDNTRALMQFLTASISTSTCPEATAANTAGCGAWIKKQEGDFEAIRVYIDAIEPPAFPRSPDSGNERYVNEGLAEEGKVLFHTRPLPAGPPPFANVTCATCHGIYSADYSNTLPSGDPRPVGIAGQIVPRDIVGTDPGRVDTLHPELRWGWGTLWFAYADNSADHPDPNRRQFDETMNDFVTSETNGDFGYTRDQGTCGWVGVKPDGTPDDPKYIGYAAPALHGIWSTAPYFHNGSVPTAYHVLRPNERPVYWRRPLREVPYTEGFIDRGFDVSLAAYDFDQLGWKFQCVTPEGEPLDVCPPTAVSGVVATARPAMPGAEVWLANQSPRPLTQAEVEIRKIYDTTRYGRSNVGHSWTAALSEEEVWKIIEYLKTL